MTSLRLKMNSAGAEYVLKHPKVLAELMRRGRAISRAAGGAQRRDATGGFLKKTVGEIGQNRARVAVIGTDPDALISAVDAGR